MSTVYRPNRKATDADIIRLNSVGLSLSTIAGLFGCHPATISLRLKALNVAPADTRRSFMEDVFISEKLGCEKPGARIFDAALRALGVENREHVLMVGDSLTSDIQGGANAGLDTCWFNPGHAENPGKVSPTYEIASLEELYPLVMEPEELANLGLKHRRHQP